MRKSLAAVGLVALLFGLGCLNYTNGFGVEHHAAWAREHGLPAPSYPMFAGGALLAVLGGAAVGFALGAGRRRA